MTNQLLAADRRPGLNISLHHLQLAALWLMIASSGFVMIEPAPYELLFGLVLLLFFGGGMHITAQLVPLVLFLALYNLGGMFSVLPLIDNSKAVTFIITSIYLGLTALFFAFATAKNPNQVLSITKSAYVLAGLATAVLGIIGYFDIGGLEKELTLYGRAKSTFKDPNVFGPFLVPPMIFLTYDVINGRTRWPLACMMVLGIMFLALLLAFSRGAWLNFIVSMAVVMMLSLLVTRSAATVNRILLASFIGGFLLVAFAAAALSIPHISELFYERISLNQPYDAGEAGRFGNQLRSLPLLLEAPNGLGPYQFHRIIGEDPHNVFVNGFAAYGWLGGLSFLILILSTLYVGLVASFTASPLQRWCIMVYGPLFATILQGISIDTDHWRHLYVLIGLMWGLFAATIAYRRQPSTPLSDRVLV